MLYGACYYPEHWDRSEWETDVQRMKEAGINVVRMADFAWKKLEPSDGVYDFDWLDEAIELLAENGISTILCTPTAGPPKWLRNKADILMRDRYGRKKEWGSRREGCANNPAYREASVRIARKMAEHYKNNENVIAWQIDNEFGCHGSARCYCEHCREAFGRWLSERYESIEELNEKWGTAFWSLDFESFEDIILPAYNSCEPENAQVWSHNPSLDLEFDRFSSDSWVAYQKAQIDEIRKFTDKPVSHNFMGHFGDLDYYNLAKDLDFVMWDNYPDNQWGDSEVSYVAMAHEIMRGLKNKNFVVAEEQSGPCGWDHMGMNPEPGQLRLWAYQALAHGGEGILYFRWKVLHYGMEQYWHGIIDHDNVPRRRYEEVKQMGLELPKVAKYFEGKKNDYDVLVYRDYDNIWAHSIKRHQRDFSYTNLVYDYYEANAHFNIMTAVSNCDFEKYKVVYMPAYNLVDDGVMEAVEKYVREGGVLVTTYRSGSRDKYNNLNRQTLPGVFKDLAGVIVEEYDPLRRETHISGTFTGTAKVWCDVLTPTTAQVLSTYADRHFKRKAAITVNEYGKGKVYYIGCDLDRKVLHEIVEYVSKDAGVRMSEATAGVEIIHREDCVILLNHNAAACEIPVKGESAFTGEYFEGPIPGYGVEIIKK